MRGITRPLVLHAKFVGRHPDPGRRRDVAEFEVTGILQRSAFGINADEAFTLGWLMIGVPLRALLLKFLLYQIHKTLDLLILGLTLIRLLIRARRGRPEWDDGLSHWQRRAAGSMHDLLYALMLATPVLGYLCAATAPSRVPTLFLGVISGAAPCGSGSGLVFGCGHAMAAVHNHRRGRRSLAMMWQG